MDGLPMADYESGLDTDEARIHMLAWVQVIKYLAHSQEQAFSNLQSATMHYVLGTDGFALNELGSALAAFAKVCAGKHAEAVEAHGLGAAVLDAKNLEPTEDEIKQAYRLAVQWGVPKGHVTLFR